MQAMDTMSTYSMPTWAFQPPLKERLRRFDRRDPLWTRALRSAGQAATRQALHHYHGFEIEGREHLPATGSFVLAANHSSHLDAPCLLAATPWSRRHRAFSAAAADYFFEHTLAAVGSVVGVNALPFDRQGGGAESLRLCRQLLTGPESTVLVIFPEGTRSVDGELGRFRSGVGRLVAGTDVPVVPCYLHGAHDALPKGGRFPRPARLRLRIGEPLRCAAEADDFDGVQRFVRGVRSAVAELGNL